MAIDKAAVLEAGFSEDAALMEAGFFENRTYGSRLFREPSSMPGCFHKHGHGSVLYRNGLDNLPQPALWLRS